MNNPFYQPDQPQPLIAICGNRGGYIQLAANLPNQEDLAYVPDTVLPAGLTWAKQLQTLGAKRVYWFCLSEVVRHYHWHIFPRWLDDEPQGWALFSQRDTENSTWTHELIGHLTQWANQHGVSVNGI